jgi:hypothetical protein
MLDADNTNKGGAMSNVRDDEKIAPVVAKSPQRMSESEALCGL